MNKMQGLQNYNGLEQQNFLSYWLFLTLENLTQAVEAGGGLSDQQHGFQTSFSTVEEVLKTFEAAQLVNHRSQK